MRILPDECVQRPIHKLLISHECITAQERGSGGLKNGDLLKRAEGEFDLFITADQNILYQQTLAGRHIRVLRLSTNNVRRIQAAAVSIQAALAAIQPGEFRQIEIP